MNRQQRRAEERRRKKHKRVTLERRDGGQPVELTLVEAYRAAYEAQQQGQLDQAIYIYNRILATEPGHIDALTNLGMIANMTGHSEEALKLLESALAKGRPTAELYLNYGVALRGVGQIGDAVAAYGKGLEIDPELAALHHNLGTILQNLGDLDTALASFRKAVEFEPNDPALWRGLANCMAVRADLPDDPTMGNEIAVCLTTPGVETQLLSRRAIGFLKNNPTMGEWIAAMKADRFILDAEKIQAMGSRLIAACLIYDIVRDADMEQLFTRLRRHLLLDAAAREQAPAILVFALPMQCFLNEYAYYETAEETAALDALITRLNTTDMVTLAGDQTGPLARDIALVGAYRPLNDMAFADTLDRLVFDNPLGALIGRQIKEPRAEAKLRITIEPLTEITGTVSTDVRAHYEENPYPRWQNTAIGSPQSMGMILVSQFPHLQGREMRYPENPRMLIAGCGTGMDAISSAATIRGAKITAMDLSLTSLAYAKRMAADFGIGSIDFRHGDILALPGKGLEFDVIQAYGVLHHMRDPLEGWRILTDCLHEAGLMRIALYSEIARQPVVAARELIAARGYPATTEGIRECRRELLALPDDHPAKPVTREGSDFFATSTCRDLLFHGEEHRFTCLQIADMIKELGLEFLGYEFLSGETGRRYAERFPEDPEFTDLRNWHALEEEFPDTFIGTDPFWVRKPER